jgi:TolB-like protein/Tfp pilus assembly protein PilF
MECPKCHIDNPDDSRFCSRCGTSLLSAPKTPPTATTQQIMKHSPVEFAPGEHFGTRYQIVEEIGRGGMGIVYKALDRELDRVVALKMIRPELSDDPAIVAQFKQELRLASEISHENVIRIHDLGEDKGIKYISMRYIGGTTLRNLLDTAGRLTIDKAIGITTQICHALGAAHKRSVVHRDLKPQNIMLDRAGHTYVMDFGVAALIDGQKRSSIIIGTPNYMSPEQAMGRTADERSDIYSLGCILYEMVTGHKPLEADTVEVMIRKHTTEIPRPPSAVNPAVPRSLESIIMKCLEKDPANRFDSASALCAQLLDDAAPAESGSEDTGVAAPSAEKPDEVSVAVLPFRDMSPEKDQDYFCDGIAEELTSALVKVDGLRVAALSSAFQFKGKNTDVREIGAKLNVSTVVEGSVRKAGNKLRITAQLVNVGDGYHMWSERYDRDLEDVFAIQDEISQAVVSALKLELIDSKGDPVVCCSTHDLEAYNLYLKGRYHWNKRTQPGISRAIEYFEKAIELEPSYALAYAGLADAYLMSQRMTPKEMHKNAKAMAEKALEIDGTLAEAHTTLAWISFVFEYNPREAENRFKRAIELNPDYPTARQWYALFLTASSRLEQAQEEIKRAQELDPLSLIISAAAGWIRYFAGRFDEAIVQAQKTIEMDPSFAPAYGVLAQAYLCEGDYSKGIATFQSMYKIEGNPAEARRIGRIYKQSGYRAAIARIIEESVTPKKDEQTSFASAAELAALLGDYEAALAYAEKALELREEALFIMVASPGFGEIRSHPRFQKIMKRMGLA